VPEIVEAQTTQAGAGERRVAATPQRRSAEEATELYAILGTYSGHVPNQP